MSTHFPDVHAAYWFLHDHPAQGYRGTGFWDTLDVEVMKINPVSREVDDDPARNTEIEIWLESGRGYTEPTEFLGPMRWHDPELDCGGPTFEVALINLAELVYAKYGPAD